MQNSDDRIVDVFNIRYSSTSTAFRLGSGSYASVYPAEYRDSSAACKEFTRDVSEAEISREVEIMKAMKGNYHIIQFLGRFASKETGNECILMEMAYNLSLVDFIGITEQLQLCRSTKRRIAADICLAVKCLHDEGIAHQDIKDSNVVLDFGLRAKLCDFGHSRKFSDGDYCEITGTPKFKAPERKIREKTGQKYDRMKSDIYSLGILLRIILGDEDLPILFMCLEDDPDKRPCCDAILQDLLPSCPVPCYSDYKFAEDEVGDADRFNICYYWTDFEPDDEEELAIGRRLLYQKSYEEAIDIFSHSEDTAANVLHGIMRFYGYGCSRDIQAAWQLFQGCDLEDLKSNKKFHLCSLIEYYLALVKLKRGSDGKDSGMKDLMHLASGGNSLAQMRLAALHSRTIMHSGSEGTHKRIHQRFLFNAAKAGYSYAQALVAFCFLYVMKKKTLPTKDYYYLVKSVEGGSALGKVLRDFVDDTINEVEVLQSKNTGLLELIAHLYLFTLAEEPAERWFREASKEGSLDACVILGILHKNTGDLTTAKEWLQKAQQLDKGRCNEEDRYWCLDHSVSKLVTWVYALADIYWKEGNYDEAARIIRNSDDTSHAALLDFANAYSDYKYHPILQSIMQEHRASMSLDNLLMVGILYQQREIDCANEWLEEGVQQGDGRAMNALGCMKLKQGAISEATELFQRAAKLGDADGLLNCGIMKTKQENGWESAKSYFEEAVTRKHPIAMAELASLLPSNDSRVIPLLEEAVVLGEEDYLFELFHRYRSYGSVEQANYSFERGLRNIEHKVMVELGIGYEDMETSYLVERSAERRSQSSLYHMGFYLMLMDKDEEAYKYFAEAALAGHRQSLLCCLALCEEQYVSCHNESSKWRLLDRERGYSGLLSDERFRSVS